MLKKGTTQRIGAYKSAKRKGDTVEIHQGDQHGIVNLGKVIKVIVEAGVVIALIVKIIA